MEIVLRRSLANDPGTWEPEGCTAYVVCPSCGEGGPIEDHSIDRMGRVTPSVSCSCSWWGDVILDEWRMPSRSRH